MKGRCPYCNKKTKLSNECSKCNHKLDSWDHSIMLHPNKTKMIDGYFCDGVWDVERGGYTYSARDMGN